MSFQVLFPSDTSSTASLKRIKGPSPRQASPQASLLNVLPAIKTPKQPKVEPERGCDVCPLNKVKGVKKILGTVAGTARVMVIAQSPGPIENEKGKELLGPAGKWWWKELLECTGLTRKDVEIQNAVKCFPADRVDNGWAWELKMRNPSTEEIRCCSVHTETALSKSKAEFIILLGAVAAKAVLGAKKLPSTKIFYSDKLKAKVYLLDHPAFFLRGYGRGPRYDQFRSTLKQLKADMEGEQDITDRFGFLRKQDYRLVVNRKQAIEASKIIREKTAKGFRAAVDIEDDTIDGKRRVVCCGFSVTKGQSFVYVFNHPEVPESDGAEVRKELAGLLEDEKVEKALQFGCSDVSKLWTKERLRVNGWTHDTMLSEYLRFSDRKAYGLVATYTSRFPEFSGYEMVVTDDMLAGVELPDRITNGTLEERYKYMESARLFSITKLSLDTLRLYNGGDCDLTKRIEVSNKKHVSDELMHLYVDLSRLLYKMEPNGPLYDYEQSATLTKIYPGQARWYKQKLISLLHQKQLVIKKINKKGVETTRVVEAEDYNPGSHEQVKAALGVVFGGTNFFTVKPNAGKHHWKAQKIDTTEATLLSLGRTHQFPLIQLKWRGAAKAESTLKSYEACAKANRHRLRTKWHAAGARTGRLRSGGSLRKTDKVVNLQNIKKDPHVQNLCVADLEWRKFYSAAQGIVAKYPKLELYWAALKKWENLSNTKRKTVARPAMSAVVIEQFKQFGAALEVWVRKYMPDLKTYLVLDYGQVEVRVMAQMSGDRNLLKDCQASDIHTRVGVTMTGWDAERIQNDEETRTLTKNVHFGIMFGLAEQGLYQFVLTMSPIDMRGRITQEEVSKAYHNYFKRYFRVKEFHLRQREFAVRHGYVETLFGMKQTLNVTDDSKQNEFDSFDEDAAGGGAYWGNQAINGPVQGTAHQLMICALVNLVRKHKKYAVLGIPPLEVHDALDFVVRVLDLPEGARKAKYLLEKESIATSKKDFGINWKIAVVTEAKAGIRLGTKVKLKDDMQISTFLAEWYRECEKQESKLQEDFAALVADALTN